MGRRPSRGHGDEEAARGNGLARLAQDERLAWYARQRSDPPAMDIYGSKTCGLGTLARDRATCAYARHVEMEEGGAPRRFSLLQPERQRPNHLLGLLDTPAPRRTCLSAAALGGDSRLQARRFHSADDAGPIASDQRSKRAYG